jgi:ABC-type polysaccharide/polyol phosphate transport system ATPase subunit
VSTVRTGEIRVEGVARKFVVRARETATLKELLVARGRTGAREVWALDDVSLQVEPGEAVGLIGRNGSGKSTLLRVIAQIIKPTRGAVAVGGRVGSLLELGAGFHPDFTGRENLFLNGSIQGLQRRQLRERFDEIVAFAELEHAIDRPVRTYSSGMTMRLGFAIAAFLDADVLLLDEVFAVGDESFQRKCFGVISSFKQRGGTIVFVSHDAASVERLCERSVLLHGGSVAFAGPTHEAVNRYRRLLTEAEAVGAAGSSAGGIVRARALAADGSGSDQYLAGEPITIEVELDGSATPVAPTLRFELRDDAGALVTEDVVDTAALGWTRDGVVLRLELPEPTLEFGRFHVHLALHDGQDGRLLHLLDDGVAFVVYPDGPGRGLVRFEGTWTAAANR